MSATMNAASSGSFPHAVVGYVSLLHHELAALAKAERALDGPFTPLASARIDSITAWLEEGSCL